MSLAQQLTIVREGANVGYSGVQYYQYANGAAAQDITFTFGLQEATAVDKSSPIYDAYPGILTNAVITTLNLNGYM